MDISIGLILRAAGTACAMYALWYAYLVLFKPAYFLNRLDIDRPINDPGAFSPRWKFRAARNLQVAAVFVGMLVLGYAIAGAFIWLLPDAPSWRDEDVTSARAATGGIVAFATAAGFLSVSRKLAIRSACFQGHLRLLRDTSDSLVRWTSPLEQSDLDRFFREAEAHLAASRSRAKDAHTAADKYAAQVEEDFWLDIVQRFGARRR